MKNKTIIYSLLILTFFACSKPTFKVDIEITNANGKTVYIQKIINNETVNIDSAVIQNNKAVLDLNINDNNDAYHIFIKGWRRALPFFADNKDVAIKGDFNSYNKIQITASETQNVLDDFNRKMNRLDENSQKIFIVDYVNNYPQSELAPYLVYRNKWLFNFSELNEISRNFPSDFNSGYYHKLMEYIRLLERTEVGKPYIDFTLDNTDGQAVNISSIIKNNKLVMIDFWASWCPDCRVENPNVVATYNEFKDKGLEIISVSLDTDKTAWLEGIKEDNLYWENHLSDLKGWNCAPASEYGVAFIPQNFLVNSDGIIVAKNLDGEKLRAFVSRYFR